MTQQTPGATNVLPVSYIVSETRCNLDEWRAYWKETNSTMETDMKKTNDGHKVKETELFVEMMSRVSDEEEWVDKSKTKNMDYIFELLKKDKLSPNSPLNHCAVSVLFNNVSTLFVKKLMQHRLIGLNITEKSYNLPKFNFWIPPVFETDPKLMVAYGQIFTQLNDIKNKIFEKLKLWENKDNDEVRKQVQDVTRIFPQGVQVNCGATAGLGTWRHLFYVSTDFLFDDETRYVMLHLGRKMKERYPAAFQDMVLQDVSGKEFGLDTLTSGHDAWKLFKFSFRCLK
jgi:thymidylate synthase ThyX